MQKHQALQEHQPSRKHLRLPRWLALAAALTFGVAGSAQAGKHLELVQQVRPVAGAAHKGPLSAYLFVYFKDETHSIYFATSHDGYTFTDVNGGGPILLGKDIALQQGVRDPHILRGPDGAFYMSMTDLHIFGKREGLRATEWERPGEQYGWGNNRDLILMKSYDLIHWTHAQVMVGELFPEFKEMGCAWAPETIVDPETGKLMVYFTTRIGSGPNYLVYSYANSAFTTLDTVPKRLFTYPKPEVNTIDADITRVGNTNQMFFVAHDRPGNIHHGVSAHVNRDWTIEPGKVDPENVSAEAPNLWQRFGTSTYVLMYDVFGAHPNNMGFAETTDFVHFRDLGRLNEGNSPMKATNFSRPKHGAVIAITPAEAAGLEHYFSPSAVKAQ